MAAPKRIEQNAVRSTSSLLRKIVAITLLALLCAASLAWVFRPVEDPWAEVRRLIATGYVEDASVKIRDLDPQGLDWRTHWLRARIYRYDGRMHEARVELQEAAKLGGDIDTLESEQLYCLAMSGKMSEAEIPLRQRINQPDVESTELCRALAVGYYMITKFAEGNKFVDAWKKDEPTNAEPWFIEGMGYNFTEHYPEATKSFQKGLELNPRRWQMRLVLASILEVQGKLDESLAELDAAIAQRPDSAEVWLRLGNLYIRLGEIDWAEDCLNRVSAGAGPEHIEMELRASCAAARLDWKGVEKSSRRLLELRPYHVDGMTLLSRALAAQGRRDELESLLEKIRSGNDRLHRIQNLTDELGRNPNSGDLLIAVGDEARDGNLDSRGFNWYQAAVEMEPANRAAHERLARHYREAGNPERAEVHERRARELPVRAPAKRADPNAVDTNAAQAS